MSNQVDIYKTFDAIIVGAGPAGCVLANRLSEERSKNVLLIEAGPDAATPQSEHPDILDPFCLNASSNPAFQWPGLTAEMRADLDDSPAHVSIPYLQGYGVGGASNINGMGADRGQPSDYDEWRDLGADGWGWADVLPYFIRLERDLDFAGPMHSQCGPMPVRRLSRSSWAPFAAAVAEALLQRDFPFIDDYMCDFREGFSSVPTNCLKHRVSAAMAYLPAEVRSRQNLAILADTNAERLSLNGHQVDGVFIRMRGRVVRLSSHQTILSCGAIQSPALLMRSGLGPGEHLAKHGIAVVCDLPGVGANLQNHPHITVTTYLRKEATQPAENLWFLQNWLRYSSHHPSCSSNDMHLMVFNRCAWHALGGRIGAVVISVLQSFSKGRIDLVSSDPAVAPRVRFNLLADSRDAERLVAGMRFVLELLTDPRVAGSRYEIFAPNEDWAATLASRNRWNRLRAWAVTQILDRTPPRRMLLGRSCIHPERLLSDEGALSAFVQRHVAMQYHVCGTCRMGRASDKQTVVDSGGVVHGVTGLRIVDASIFPTVPRGYTHFIVLMAAEKIADTIKADWCAGLRGHAREACVSERDAARAFNLGQDQTHATHSVREHHAGGLETSWRSQVNSPRDTTCASHKIGASLRSD